MEHQKQTPDQVNVSGGEHLAPAQGSQKSPLLLLPSALTLPALHSQGLIQPGPHSAQEFSLSGSQQRGSPCWSLTAPYSYKQCKAGKRRDANCSHLTSIIGLHISLLEGHFSQTGLLLPNLFRIRRHSQLPALGGTKRNYSNLTKSSTNQDVLSKDTDFSL